MHGFLQPLRQPAPLPGCGALFCFSASFGQVFFIAVFGGAIRAAFGLGHGSLGAARGRAISIATPGIAAREVVVPPLAVPAPDLGRRRGRRAFAAVLLLAILPLLPALWRRAERRPVVEAARLGTPPRPVVSLRQGEVLSDRRLWLLLPGLLSASMPVTGIFFHHVLIGVAEGWSLGLFAALFTVYATAAVARALCSGRLVDRPGARRPLIVFPSILARGCLLPAPSDAFVAGLGMMLLFGIVAGGQSTTTSAPWAEPCGTAQSGAIRSLAMAFMVMGSALSRIVFGAVLDQGISVEAAAMAAALDAALAGMPVIPALRQPERQAEPAA